MRIFVSVFMFDQHRRDSDPVPRARRNPAARLLPGNVPGFTALAGRQRPRLRHEAEP